MSEKYGFVYLVAHPDMPHVYKVGCTERSPHQRMRELSSSTSVPRDFEMLCYIEVENPFLVEANFHKWLNDHRVSPGREFFTHKNLRWLAGIFKYYDGALAFVQIELMPKLYDLAMELEWGEDECVLMDPYRRSSPPPDGAHQPPENTAANDGAEKAA